MPINFDKLPKENPGALPAPGIYLAKVTKAEMRTPQKKEGEPQKPQYINMQLALTNRKGQKCGVIFDMLMDSDKPAMQYKLGRFITASGIQLTGDFELKDLCKIITGVELCAEIEHQADNRPQFKDDRTHDSAKVKVFGSDSYWPASQFKDLTALDGEDETSEGGDDAPFEFDAADGVANSGESGQY